MHDEIIELKIRPVNVFRQKSLVTTTSGRKNLLVIGQVYDELENTWKTDKKYIV